MMKIQKLLPSTNEVWGKVIFLGLSVILFTGEGLPHCMLGSEAGPPGAMHAERYGQQAGGTHPD